MVVRCGECVKCLVFGVKRKNHLVIEIIFVFENDLEIIGQSE